MSPSPGFNFGLLDIAGLPQGFHLHSFHTTGSQVLYNMIIFKVLNQWAVSQSGSLIK